MKIIEKVEEPNVLRIVVDSNEESLFSLLRVYLEESSDVELVGLYKEHYLLDKTELVLKTKSKNALAVFKKELAAVKKELKSMKVK